MLYHNAPVTDVRRIVERTRVNENGFILLIENDETELAANRRLLTGAGYAVLAEYSLAGARKILETLTPDLIILETALPDGDGPAFMPELKRLCPAPVIFLTARAAREDRLAGLSAGGNDYIIKPFDREEFLARVKNFINLSRDMKNTPDYISVGALRLDTVARQAFLNGEDMGLYPKEFDLLYLLASNENRPLSLKYVYERVWGQSINENAGAVKTAVSRLRTKLSAAGFLIETKRGAGYCFKCKET